MARVSRSVVGVARLGPFERDFCQAAQLGDGGAEFVREIGAELALPFEGLLQARQKIIQAGADGGQLARQSIGGEAGGQGFGVDAGGAFGERIQRGQVRGARGAAR